MATITKLAVELSLTDNLTAKLQSVADGVGKVGDRINQMGQTLTTRVTLPLVGLGLVGVKAASDLNEAMSAMNTTFGTSATTIETWSRTSATSLGISQQAALTAATQFGALGTNLGMTTDEAATFSMTMVQAAADLGSFYNLPTGQVLDDLRSGIVGQYEPLLKYGIVLTEATVKQKAMAMTGKTVEASLTAQELVAARYALIMDGLGVAQGDFARTSTSTANSLKIAQAEFQNAAAALGTLLLPYVTQAVQAFTNLMQRLQALSPEQQKLVVIIAAVAAAIGPVLIVLGQMAIGFSVVAAAINPVTLAIVGIIAVIAALYYAYQNNFLGFRDGVQQGLAWLQQAFDSLKPSIDKLVTAFMGVVDALLVFQPEVQKAGEFLRAAFEASLPIITVMLETAGALVLNFVTTVIGVLTGMLRSIKGILQILKGVFTGDFGLIKEGVTNLVGGLKDSVVALVKGMLNQIKIQLTATKVIFVLLWAQIKDEVVSIVTGLVDSVVGLVTGMTSSVYNAGYNAGYAIGQGIIAGIAAIWDSVTGYAASLVDAVIGILSDVPGFSPIEHVGQYYGAKLGSGFAEGIASATKATGSAASGLVSGAMGGMTTNMGGLTFNINGAGNPQATADAVWSTFARELSLREGV